MNNKFSLPPKIIQHAKQVYIHLGLHDKQKTLTKTNLHNLPDEIQKMHLLFCTDEAELTNVVRKFLLTSQRSKKKGTLGDFVRAINVALDSVCQEDNEWAMTLMILI
ncbi:unnamed protein product [Absidia cylindrospora]